MHELMEKFKRLPLKVMAATADNALVGSQVGNPARSINKPGHVTFEIHIRTEETPGPIRRQIAEILSKAKQRGVFKNMRELIDGPFYSHTKIAVSHEIEREDTMGPELKISLPWEMAQMLPMLKEALTEFKVKKWQRPVPDPGQARRVISQFLPKGLQGDTPVKKARRGNPLEDDRDYPAPKD